MLTDLIGQRYSPYLQQFSVEDGLSNSNITAIWTDSRGIIWIGTQYGLNRFDGHRFKSYTVEGNGLCQNAILKINEDQAGNLWILGGEPENALAGLCVFNPITEEARPFENYIDGKIPFDFKKTTWSDSHLGHIIFREEKQNAYHFYILKKQQILPLFDLPKKDYNFGVHDQMMAQADGSFVTTVQPDGSNGHTGSFVFF